MTAEQCLIAEYDSMEAAKVGLEVLQTADFDDQSLSLVTQADDQALHAEDPPVTDPSDSPPTGDTATLGGVIGGSVGGMVGMASMIGPFMVAGPLLGIAAGSGLGSALAATDKWGVQKDVANDYANRVENGSVLILVNGTDEVRQDEAERLLKTTGPSSMRRFKASSEPSS